MCVPNAATDMLSKLSNITPQQLLSVADQVAEPWQSCLKKLSLTGGVQESKAQEPNTQQSKAQDAPRLSPTELAAHKESMRKQTADQRNKYDEKQRRRQEQHHCSQAEARERRRRQTNKGAGESKSVPDEVELDEADIKAVYSFCLATGTAAEDLTREYNRKKTADQKSLAQLAAEYGVPQYYLTEEVVKTPQRLAKVLTLLKNKQPQKDAAAAAAILEHYVLSGRATEWSLDEIDCLKNTKHWPVKGAQRIIVAWTSMYDVGEVLKHKVQYQDFSNPLVWTSDTEYWAALKGGRESVVVLWRRAGDPETVLELEPKPTGLAPDANKDKHAAQDKAKPEVDSTDTKAEPVETKTHEPSTASQKQARKKKNKTNKSRSFKHLEPGPWTMKQEAVRVKSITLQDAFRLGLTKAARHKDKLQHLHLMDTLLDAATYLGQVRCCGSLLAEALLRFDNNGGMDSIVPAEPTTMLQMVTRESISTLRTASVNEIVGQCMAHVTECTRSGDWVHQLVAAHPGLRDIKVFKVANVLTPVTGTGDNAWMSKAVVTHGIARFKTNVDNYNALAVVRKHFAKCIGYLIRVLQAVLQSRGQLGLPQLLPYAPASAYTAVCGPTPVADESQLDEKGLAVLKARRALQALKQEHQLQHVKDLADALMRVQSTWASVLASKEDMANGKTWEAHCRSIATARGILQAQVTIGENVTRLAATPAAAPTPTATLPICPVCQKPGEHVHVAHKAAPIIGRKKRKKKQNGDVQSNLKLFPPSITLLPRAAMDLAFVELWRGECAAKGTHDLFRLLVDPLLHELSDFKDMHVLQCTDDDAKVWRQPDCASDTKQAISCDSVLTDGYSLRLVYRIWNLTHDKTAIANGAKAKAKKIQVVDQDESISDDSELSISDDAFKFLTGVPSLYKDAILSNSEVRRLLSNSTVWIADPGKRYIFTALKLKISADMKLDSLDSTPGKCRRWRLSQGQYQDKVHSSVWHDGHAAYLDHNNWQKRRGGNRGFVPRHIGDLFKACRQGLGSNDVDQYLAACRAMGDDASNWTALPTSVQHGSVEDVIWTWEASHAQRAVEWGKLDRKNRLFASILSTLAPAKTDIIVIGSGYDGRAHQGCSTGSSPLPGLLRYLGSHRRVILLSEYHTTAACSSCSSKPFERQRYMRVGKAGKELQGVTICPCCHKTASRDSSAATNIAKMLLHVVFTGLPPANLRWLPGNMWAHEKKLPHPAVEGVVAAAGSADRQGPPRKGSTAATTAIKQQLHKV